MHERTQFIKRRRYLSFLGISATMSVAGCIGDDDEADEPDETGDDDEETEEFEGICDRQTAQDIIDEWQETFWGSEPESVEQLEGLIHSDWFTDEQVEELFESLVETDENPLGDVVTVEYGHVESISQDFEELITFIEEFDIVADRYFEQLIELGYILEEDQELENLFLASTETTKSTEGETQEDTMLVLLAPEDGDCKLIGDLIYLDVI